jgi:tRNA(Met) cytidine acetyltransferase
MQSLVTLSAQMAREGIRRLLVLSGSAAWCADQAEKLRDALPGDWLWVGEEGDGPQHCSPRALTTLLGREFSHAVVAATGSAARSLGAAAGR